MRFWIVAAAALLAPASVQAQSRDTAARVFADSGPRAPVRPVTPCVVERIVDGDTIRCVGLRAVRLIGMDAPEGNQQPFGDSATAGMSSLVRVGDTVHLEPDVEARDRYRRQLAYVWRGGTMLNWLMVRLGCAVALTVPPNVQFVDHFVTAQDRAQAEQRGLWRIDGFRCLPAQRRRGAC